MNPTYPGFYRATVTDNADPKGLGRVRLRIPQILGDGATGWAYPMGEAAAPSVGTQVWATFEGGDISFPVYLYSPAQVAPIPLKTIVPASKVDWSLSGPLPYVNYDNYWIDIAYGNDRFVATNESGITAVSTDGVNWGQGAFVPDNYAIYSRNLAYGNGRFVALTYGTSNYKAYVSSDGYGWSSTSLSWRPGISLEFAGGIFMAIGNQQTLGNARAYLSSNGSTWSQGGLIAAGSWFTAWSIAYGSGKWVVVGAGSSDNAYVSSDGGSTWSGMNLPNTAYNVAYGDGKFIASNPYDGVSWSDGTTLWESIPDLNDWWEPSYRNGEWLLSNNGQNPNHIATSVDGFVWSFREIPSAVDNSDGITQGESYVSAYGNGTYVLVSYYGGQAVVGTQPA